MATIIRKEAKPCGTARSRYKARRAVLVAERHKYKMLERKIAVAMAGCSRNVARATSLTPMREQQEETLPARSSKYYAVTNEAGRQIHVTQKQCRQSVPAYYD